MATPHYKFSIEDLVAVHDSFPKDSVEFYDKFGSVAELAKGLNTDLSTGIASTEVESHFAERRAVFGKNVLPEAPLRSLGELIFEGLQDTTLIMLMIAAVISLVLGIAENPAHGWIEGTAILIAVFLVVMVASVNDYQKERQFRKLNEKKENKLIKVIRGGEQQEISTYEINVGELIVLATGDIPPADGVLVEGQSVQVDNSAINGESEEVKVNQKLPFIYASSMVCNGYGRMIATCIGPNSVAGRTMEKLQVRSEETPLQEKLGVLANDQIATAGLIAAGTILVVLTIKLAIVTYLSGHGFSWHLITQVVGYFVTAITIVVVAVPEGLPLAVTIALAYSMLQMVKDQNLVRHLDACETMGGATTICSDKTGTLTKNQMTVVKGWFGGKLYDSVADIKELGADFEGALHEGINTNTTVYLGKTEKGIIEFIGNKTECALLNLSKSLGANYNNVRSSTKVYKLYPFSSLNKSMTVVVERDQGNYRAHTKGASEIVTQLCKSYINTSGDLVPITPEIKKDLDATILNLASQGLRTIGLVYRDVASTEKVDWEHGPSTQDSILVGIAGIKDPLRDEVKGAVAECQSAGIVVRMVTGDNINTAKRIAEECGILTAGGIAIEGPDFRKLSEAEMDKIIPNLQVMARSSPTDKHLLVNRLKALGEVVAVTGDGTNDAPALKEAHVGFAMGIQGTEVAKEASDIILMDDNFSSIVKAVMWGRNVYDSIRKFLQFQLTVNVVAVLLAFIGAVFNDEGESPLRPVQLLWVNLIMDTLAALALATDPPSHDLLKRPPYGKDDQLITNRMWLNIIGQSIFQMIVNLILLFGGSALFGLEQDSVLHRTLIFNVFVVCQLFNELNCRKLGVNENIFDGLLTNHLCLGIFFFTGIMQFLLVQFGGEWVGTVPLNATQWVACIAVGALSIPVAFLLRLVPVKEVNYHRATVAERAAAATEKGKSSENWGKDSQE
eukprot:TRINITY_DN1782_c1_g1_i2.p1 TRINITY_DN1782_c1_g1~~TRINITY_DN1782_c1_g1_i2.p1  ORF type:complete len:959 (+),score=539.43 TRINITY_DN1782_c1_g1_i2:44-2920(+)